MFLFREPLQFRTANFATPLPLEWALPADFCGFTWCPLKSCGSSAIAGTVSINKPHKLRQHTESEQSATVDGVGEC